MMECLGVQISCIRSHSGGVVREAERAEGVAVEGELARDEIDSLFLACFEVILYNKDQNATNQCRSERHPPGEQA